ncbi:hypothetical protein BCV69DRAFT_54192 [Microstroma glucosiphilum]|uniref:Uncharacterized protein n=1 Tax=Pseudomicrostroma glucosiphilum TaxID=1684307 RepID=A0A316U3M4_9BASI|nr:hypothetical protein BCV69DRAFT_54192 [Pseudomicrostroma glucosiphilum]PWN18963.1 hypothetical protein BCV69DRAFT_54192 [Pseudomicrostroma glucosiphilum]
MKQVLVLEFCCYNVHTTRAEKRALCRREFYSKQRRATLGLSPEWSAPRRLTSWTESDAANNGFQGDRSRQRAGAGALGITQTITGLPVSMPGVRLGQTVGSVMVVRSVKLDMLIYWHFSALSEVKVQFTKRGNGTKVARGGGQQAESDRRTSTAGIIPETFALPRTASGSRTPAHHWQQQQQQQQGRAIPSR